MEFVSQISDWLFENESAISALAGLLAIAVILFVPTRALWHQLRSSSKAEDKTPEPQVTTPDRPSILVLPFDDLSEGAVQGVLVDGFTEDLTTLLAKMPGYFVFARNTAFTFKGSAIDVQEIGRSMNARYVLEGSIRPMGEKVRVTAQLIEADSGVHLWAEKFDRPSAQLHESLDEMARMIALQLGGELTRAEATLSLHNSNVDQGAWELLQQAKMVLMKNGWSEQSFSDAAALARQCIEADPEYGAPRAYLSLLLAIGHWVKLVPDPQAAHDESLVCAEKALELSPNSSEVLGYVGCAFSDLGYRQRGIPIIEKAIELDPSNAQAFAALGAAKIVSGELDEGIAQLEHAIELSPKDAGYAPWSTLLSISFALQGEEEKSLAWARSACKSDPRYYLAQIAHARALASNGKIEDASQALAEAKRQLPTLNKAYIAGFMGNWVVEQMEAKGLAIE